MTHSLHKNVLTMHNFLFRMFLVLLQRKRFPSVGQLKFPPVTCARARFHVVLCVTTTHHPIIISLVVLILSRSQPQKSPSPRLFLSFSILYSPAIIGGLVTTAPTSLPFKTTPQPTTSNHTKHPASLCYRVMYHNNKTRGATGAAGDGGELVIFYGGSGCRVDGEARMLRLTALTATGSYGAATVWGQSWNRPHRKLPPAVHHGWDGDHRRQRRRDGATDQKECWNRLCKK